MASHQKFPFPIENRY